MTKIDRLQELKTVRKGLKYKLQMMLALLDSGVPESEVEAMVTKKIAEKQRVVDKKISAISSFNRPRWRRIT